MSEKDSLELETIFILTEAAEKAAKNAITYSKLAKYAKIYAALAQEKGEKFHAKEAKNAAKFAALQAKNSAQESSCYAMRTAKYNAKHEKISKEKENINPNLIAMHTSKLAKAAKKAAETAQAALSLLTIKELNNPNNAIIGITTNEKLIGEENE